MKVTNQETTYLKKSVEYTIEIKDGVLVHICKWWEQDAVFDNYEVDWEPSDEASKKIIDAMTDEQSDEFSEFVTDLG
jgi:hypothetical protein